LEGAVHLVLLAAQALSMQYLQVVALLVKQEPAVELLDLLAIDLEDRQTIIGAEKLAVMIHLIVETLLYKQIDLHMQVVAEALEQMDLMQHLVTEQVEQEFLTLEQLMRLEAQQDLQQLVQVILEEAEAEGRHSLVKMEQAVALESLL
jgi:hypothetical protein